MNHQAILEELLEVIAGRNITIRNENLGGGGGGLCQFKDNQIFFLDTQAGTYDSALKAGRAVLAIVEDTDTIFLKPAVREFLDKIREID